MKIAQISLIQGQVHMTSLFKMKHKPKLGITPLDSQVLIMLEIKSKNLKIMIIMRKSLVQS